jgi:uncharacterized membrane protein
MKDVMREKTERGIHDVYIVTVVGKGIVALLEVILGIMFLFTNSITQLIIDLINNEIIEDPSDFFAGHLQSLLHPTPQAQVFAGFYLLSHGVVKVFLVAALLRKKVWAYPASIAVFSLFIMYQLFRYFFKTHSGWLLVITVLDIVAIWLIYHEYKSTLRRATINTNGSSSGQA